MDCSVSVQVQFHRYTVSNLRFENSSLLIFARQIFSSISIQQIDCCTGDCRRCDGNRCFIVSVSTRKDETAQSYIDETGAGLLPPHAVCLNRLYPNDTVKRK